MAASKSPQLRLFHIRDEIDGVTTALHGVSFDEYRESFMLRRAAERAVQIVLRHEYQRIDDRRLWEILTVHLPQLRPVIVSMIAGLEP